MADSTKGKNKKTLDAFADDLDAMLNMDETPVAQKVGAIEEDDAIERLLMGDNFKHAEQDDADRDEFADIDALIGDEIEGNRKMASEIDEFGDDIDNMIANIQINPSRKPEPAIGDVDEFADIDADVGLVKSIDEVTPPEVTALESVAEIDEFADDTAPISAVPRIQTEEIEGMKEIDEFSDESPVAGTSADFLMADFDISVADDAKKPIAEEQLIDEFGEDALETPVAPASPAAAVGQAAEASVAESMPDEFAETEPVNVVAATTVAEKSRAEVDKSEEIAALMTQITVLKKQQQIFKQEITEKAGNDELSKCLGDIETLQAEQKKNRRAIDAVGNKKPVAAYIASGLAVTALLVGTGLGFQGYIAKSQIGELVPIIGKLQERINATPVGDASSTETLYKRLDELTAATSLASNQIAEINKALQGNGGATKAGGDLGKRLAELSNQNMQMGAAIEALQNKVGALEKGRVVAAQPAPKPQKKKPAVVEENWAVNLIAFKQDWYAKRKAEEFTAKGVPAKVIKTESKGETWYRLFVDGFKSQYEAAGYAAKVKKTLNLDSVWVTRNKE